MRSLVCTIPITTMLQFVLTLSMYFFRCYYTWPVSDNAYLWIMGEKMMNNPKKKDRKKVYIQYGQSVENSFSKVHQAVTQLLVLLYKTTTGICLKTFLFSTISQGSSVLKQVLSLYSF